jgi:hypothetical protein
MQQALNYVNTAISHAHSWKLIKPHMLQIIQVVYNFFSVIRIVLGLLDPDP